MRAFGLWLTVLLGCAAGLPDDGDVVLSPGPVDGARLRDGVWSGSVRQGPNRATVELEVRGGRIVAVRILRHTAWKGVIAEEPVTRQIVERQAMEVDVVSGATNSSRVLMRASQAAVERSYGTRR
jgi:uncharacterized protein with FMN-binding domain